MNKVYNSPGAVDVGYVVGHFLAGYVYSRELKNLNTVDSRIKLALLALWTIRLGGFLFKNRTIHGHKDPRYERVFKSKSQYKDLIILLHY